MKKIFLTLMIYSNILNADTYNINQYTNDMNNKKNIYQVCYFNYVANNINSLSNLKGYRAKIKKMDELLKLSCGEQKDKYWDIMNQIMVKRVLNDKMWSKENTDNYINNLVIENLIYISFLVGLNFQK